MPRTLLHRRLGAAVALALYATLTLGLPLGHLVGHRGDHRHDAATGDIDWNAVRSPQTGRVDLARLAQALGLEDAQHAAAHREQRPHRHPGCPEGTPLDHGAGVLAHFGVALGPPLPPLAAVAVQPVERVEASIRLESAGVARRLFLAVQRAQAPPTRAMPAAAT